MLESRLRPNRLLPLLVAALASTQVQAGDFTIELGGFYSQSDSNMQVTNPSTGNNFTLDYESDLQLAENEFLPFVELNYHFNERHNIYIDWKQLHRSAETLALAKPFQIEINDTIYDIKAGGKLNSTLNIDILRLGYGYDIFQGSNYDVGVSLGLHTMFIKMGFEGVIGVCAASELLNNVCGSQAIPRMVDENITAPLPDIGLYANYEFTPGWELVSHAQYFSVKLDDVEGELVDVKLGIDAQITSNWSMSVAYNYYKVDVDIAQKSADKATQVANYNIYYSFIGPMLSVSYTF
ncbi:DUF481 domain-containing protein [Shewanella sp. CG12_big_fil_rev_8_21_14_0_65_47_15]|uniref:DUF481 domain-containing protein n=1 Tax=Shewanella sp. CG12_big_fil_rev_8_21_14_0_65_47_15 TaxID=1975537 RepID=UPI0025D6D852|nr:DUF481 domain-containing protein [Shewanella sp. CG12_big_fil_rev_8_21_14_0_65_47_15]